MQVVYQAVACKFCGSVRVVKYGRYHRTQRFLCRACGRKFADNEALPNMQTPTPQIIYALNAYYEGMPLSAIQRQIETETGNVPSDSTVYRWVKRFGREAVDETRDIRPKVGDVWVAFETVIGVGGKNVWLWDIMDTRTRFLLAARLSSTRTAQDARAIMEKAAERAGNTPRLVLTDEATVYSDSIEMAYGPNTRSAVVRELASRNNATFIYRLHGTLKQRTTAMRGLKSRDTVILEGFLVYYNYFRPNEALKGKTPAEAAGVTQPSASWEDVVCKSAPALRASSTTHPKLWVSVGLQPATIP